MLHKAYAVVAANASVLLAFATVANVNEKRAVKNIVTATLAMELLTKYKTRIEVVGKREERMVLMALATATKLASS